MAIHFVVVLQNQPGEITLEADIQFEEGYDAAELTVALIEGINVGMLVLTAL